MELWKLLATNGAVGFLAFCVATWIRNRAPYKLAQLQGEAELRADLMLVVKELRTELSDERAKCESKIAVLEADNQKLHGQIHELRNQMAKLAANQRRPQQVEVVNTPDEPVPTKRVEGE